MAEQTLYQDKQITITTLRIIYDKKTTLSIASVNAVENKFRLSLFRGGNFVTVLVAGNKLTIYRTPIWASGKAGIVKAAIEQALFARK